MFNVVMDEHLKHDIMIGREILALCFGITMDADKFSIFKSKQINSISDETITNYKLFDENYDLSDNDKSKLKNIVDQYTEHFIVGIPSRRVTTGELEIRLLDANKTVQRRPYRLRVDEKELVRDKIKEMLAANVIRPSNFPFSSPILLVKKMAVIVCA